jgi:hypothetical protein
MKINLTAMRHSLTLVALAIGVTAGLSACGGGGGGSAASSGATAAPTVAAAAAGTTSTGVITAFGSVFVGGHEFATGKARFIDDDTDASSGSAAGLEVGMVVDVKPSKDSSKDKPDADELHIHPLARGFVDVADTAAGTLKVMGQTVLLTSSTNFSDHRACATALPATCTAVATAAGLTDTASGNPSNYVAVHGYLYSSTTGSANIVATLVSVADAPVIPTGLETASGVKRANFKAEGLVLAVATNSVTVGGLTVDLSSAKCLVAKVQTACAAAFSVGQVVAVGSAVAPTLPATTLVADFARLASKTSVDSSGSAVEMEGVVSSTTSASFVLRGVTIDASALAAGTTLPAVGDVVRVLGTVAASGQSVTASSVVILHTSSSVKLGLEGDASAVSTVTAGTSYTVSVLGQTVTVNAQTRLMDMSVRGWDSKPDPAANPFNVSTFATYLDASVSKHLVIKAETDAAGNLVAHSLAIMRTSAAASVAGLVDASPAVVNSTLTGTPTTLSVHGLSISADPAALRVPGRQQPASVTIVAGDQVVARGTWANGTLTVGATFSGTNQLLDAGVPKKENEDRGEF